MTADAQPAPSSIAQELRDILERPLPDQVAAYEELHSKLRERLSASEP